MKLNSPSSMSWVHRVAAAAVGTTLILIAVGGLVTNTGSALAVPDWPTTFGHNMFTYPPSQWKGGVLYEHTHRLLGSLVGFLTVVLAIVAWRWESRWWVRWLCVFAVVGVLVQGVIGGLRVVLLEHSLAIVHGCVAQAFLGLLTLIWVVTSPSWNRTDPGGAGRGTVNSGRLPALLLLALPLAVYLQIIFGAFLTHRGGLLWLHVAGALVVSVMALGVIVLCLFWHLADRAIRRPVLLLAGLVTLQLSLGILAYLWHFGGMYRRVPYEAGLVVLALHRVSGSLVWVTSLVLAIRFLRRANRASDEEPARELAWAVATRPVE